MHFAKSGTHGQKITTILPIGDFKLIKLVFTLCVSVVLALNGCSSQQEEVSQSKSEGMFQNTTLTPATNAAPLELRDYVRELVSEMAINLKSVDSARAIAVTNFAFSDLDYDSTNELGHALADTFMMELHQFGFKTLDFKVTDYIRITPQGDFAMSRDYLELKADYPVDYVLVGKITDYKKGYRVLARIVDIKSKNILATGESFIPKNLVHMLMVNKRFNAKGSALRVSS